MKLMQYLHGTNLMFQLINNIDILKGLDNMEGTEKQIVNIFFTTCLSHTSNIFHDSRRKWKWKNNNKNNKNKLPIRHIKLVSLQKSYKMFLCREHAVSVFTILDWIE